MTFEKNPDPMWRVRDQIRDRIKDRRYSMRSVATAAHVSAASLTKWLAGKRSTMPRESIRRVALVLGWSLVVPTPRLVPLPPIAARASQHRTPEHPAPTVP